MDEVRHRSWRERLAQTLSLPADVVAGMPLIELVGDGRLRVENHRGVLAYGPDEIHVGGGKLAIRVRGSGLELAVMNRRELLITGHIFGVDLE